MKTIKIDGFTNDIQSTVGDAIIMAIYGPEGSGKTRMLATAPGPLGIIPLDRKTRWTINKMAKELGRKDIFMPPDDFIRHANPIQLSLMKGGEAEKYYGEHVKRVMEAAYKLNQHPDIRAVGLDGGAQLWEDILFKHYGRNQRIMPRDRGAANQEMRDLLNSLQEKNLVITHKSREVWRNEKPTGDLDVAGFNDIGYYTNVLVEHSYQPAVSKAKNWHFSLSVRMCQANASLQGTDGQDLLTDGDIGFQALACQVYPDSNWEDWE